MSKRLYFLFLLASMPLLSMESPCNFQTISPESSDSDHELDFYSLKKELHKIIDYEPTRLPFAKVKEVHCPYQKIRAQLLDVIDEDADQQETLLNSIEFANRFCVKSPNKITPTTKTAHELAAVIVAQKHAKDQHFIDTYLSLGTDEAKFRDMLEATTSLADIEPVKKVLETYQKWYAPSTEWNSDLQEMALAHFSKKFGFHEKLKELALYCNTPGALRWLSKQKIACQTIPFEKLEKMLLEARVAFSDADEPKALALISVLNNTALKDETQNQLCRALSSAIVTVKALKNQAEMEHRIMDRIHILGHAGYDLRKQWGPILMKNALDNNLGSIAKTLELYRVDNPKKIEPTQKPVEFHCDNSEPVADFTCEPLPATKRKIQKDRYEADTWANQ